MKITKNKLTLKIPSGRSMPSIQNEIRENLSRMGVDGLSIDIRYDVRSNVSLIRFTFKGKSYEMRITNQKDVRLAMWAINKRVEYKARMHLLGIEPFDISVSPYLMLEDKDHLSENFNPVHASPKNYAILGIPEYSSNEDIEKTYKKLVKAFHPDMALSSEAKVEFEKRLAEINSAYDEIKKERGMN